MTILAQSEMIAFRFQCLFLYRSNENTLVIEIYSINIIMK